jgi:hypothetical protein
MAQRSSWASYAIWGSIAVCAVLASAVTITLVVGNHRGIQFASFIKRSPPPSSTEAASSPPAGSASVPEPVVTGSIRSRDHEIARLSDALRILSSERERLEERVQKLEQSLGDITASIRERASAPQPVQSAPRNPDSADGTTKASEPVKSLQRIAAAPTQMIPPEAARPSIPAAGIIGTPGGEAFLPFMTRPVVSPPTASREPMQIHAVPLAREDTPPPVQTTAATRTEFAVDLGAEPNMDALRARWANLRSTHAPVLGNLRPLVSLRDGSRPGSVELRLIAGPLNNAGDAAKTCASLQSKGVNCQTAVFDGQRLALR